MQIFKIYFGKLLFKNSKLYKYSSRFSFHQTKYKFFWENNFLNIWVSLFIISFCSSWRLTSVDCPPSLELDHTVNLITWMSAFSTWESRSLSVTGFGLQALSLYILSVTFFIKQIINLSPAQPHVILYYRACTPTNGIRAGFHVRGSGQWKPRQESKCQELWTVHRCL